MDIEVSLLNPKKMLFRGSATSVILPGEQGEFELQPYHKSMMSRLITGMVFIDDNPFPVKRGIVRFSENKAVIIIE